MFLFLLFSGNKCNDKFLEYLEKEEPDFVIFFTKSYIAGKDLQIDDVTMKPNVGVVIDEEAKDFEKATRLGLDRLMFQ